MCLDGSLLLEPSRTSVRPMEAERAAPPVMCAMSGSTSGDISAQADDVRSPSGVDAVTSSVIVVISSAGNVPAGNTTERLPASASLTVESL
eukprot:3988260-Prymnesium_polylepis.3